MVQKLLPSYQINAQPNNGIGIKGMNVPLALRSVELLRLDYFLLSHDGRGQNSMCRSMPIDCIRRGISHFAPPGIASSIFYSRFASVSIVRQYIFRKSLLSLALLSPKTISRKSDLE